MEEQTHLQNPPSEPEGSEECESMFLNVDAAKDFINACPDHVDREVLWMAYATVTFRMAPSRLDSKFDMLFFVRVLTEMLNDRAQLLSLLSEK